MQRCSTGTARDDYLAKGFLRSVSAGIGSQKGVLRYLGEEHALAVKDANPRISRHRLAMDKLLFWLGIGAAQKGASGSKPTVDRHWVVSLVVGTLIALLIAAGMFVLLVSQQ
jgi:hypothetical protein